MVWVVIYLTWKYRLKLASNNRALFQSGLLMRPNRTCVRYMGQVKCNM